MKKIYAITWFIIIVALFLLMAKVKCSNADGTPDEYAYHPKSEQTEEQKQTEALKEIARELKQIKANQEG